MNQQTLNRFEENGLSCPFIIARSGETTVSEKNAGLKSKLSQMGTVIYESIGAVGRIKVETVEMLGEAKALVLEVGEEMIIGGLCDRSSMRNIDELLTMIKDLRTSLKPAPAAVPEVKPKTVFSAAFLDELKSILKEYVGDFTDRIYQNQFKAQRINPNELSEEDVRRFILALGKAAGMIIGPSKGRELINKLLAKVK